jgi:hypothetical protein
MEHRDNSNEEERQRMDASSKDVAPTPTAPSQDDAYKGLLKKAVSYCIPICSFIGMGGGVHIIE